MDENTEQVRADRGGWLSGPCLDEALPIVPPGSTPIRHLLATIERTLRLPTPATTKAELIYLRTSRDRARIIMQACHKASQDHELDDEDITAMAQAINLACADLPPDSYDANPLEF